MSLAEEVVSFIGTPQTPVGSVMIDTGALFVFFILLEGFMYILWKKATGY